MRELIHIYEENISTESQCATADALSSIGPAASNAIPALLRGVKYMDDYVRMGYHFGARQNSWSNPESVLPELVKLLHDPNYAIRGIAIEGLGDFGTNAWSAVPVLIEMLSDQDAYNRASATQCTKKN